MYLIIDVYAQDEKMHYSATIKVQQNISMEIPDNILDAPNFSIGNITQLVVNVAIAEYCAKLAAQPKEEE